jgi:acyl carrier protein
METHMDTRFTDAVAPHLRFLNDQPLEPQAKLADLGLDSMHAIDLLFDLEDTFGIAFPDDDLNETTFATAGSLWNTVQRVADDQDVPVGEGSA